MAAKRTDQCMNTYVAHCLRHVLSAPASYRQSISLDSLRQSGPGLSLFLFSYFLVFGFSLLAGNKNIGTLNTVMFDDY